MLQHHPLHPHLHSPQWRNVHADTPDFTKLLSPSCSVYTHPNTNTHTPPRNKLLEPRSCQGGKMALQPRSQSDSLARAGDHRPADPASRLLSSSVLMETFWTQEERLRLSVAGRPDGAGRGGRVCDYVLWRAAAFGWSPCLCLKKRWKQLEDCCFFMTDNNHNDPFGPITFDRHGLLCNSANVGEISWTTIFKMAATANQP